MSVAVIDKLPNALPTDFIVGAAGLGSVTAFAGALIGRVMEGRFGGWSADPLRAGGYGAGTGGIIAVLSWLLSLVVELILR